MKTFHYSEKPIPRKEPVDIPMKTFHYSEKPIPPPRKKWAPKPPPQSDIVKRTLDLDTSVTSTDDGDHDSMPSLVSGRAY